MVPVTTRHATIKADPIRPPKRYASNAAKQPLSMKLPNRIKPWYWNGSGNTARIALRGIASKGRESEKTMLFPTTYPNVGLAPGGHRQWSRRKKSQPRKWFIMSPPFRNHPMLWTSTMPQPYK